MDKFLNITMDFLYKNEKDMNEEKAEIIRYGLELFLLKVVFFSSTLIIGIIMDSFWEFLIFTFFFSNIRAMAGGYHAKTRIQCFIQSTLTFIITLGILKIETIEYLLPILILFVFSFVIIWKLSPVDTENKRLDEDERIVFRKKARVTLIIESVIAGGAYSINFYRISISAMLATIITALLMLVEIFISKRKRENDE